MKAVSKACGEVSKAPKEGPPLDLFVPPSRTSWKDLTLPDARYQGGWRDELMQGLGALISNTGEHRIGEFNKGSLEGPGVMVLQDGSVLCGEWGPNGLDGHGLLVSAAEGTYHGEFDRSNGSWGVGKQPSLHQLNGNGALTTNDGWHYQGFWRGGRLHGEGSCRSPGGVEWRGLWLDGELQGEVEVLLADGAGSYVGEMWSGSPKGKSNLRWSCGATFCGELKGSWSAAGQGTLTLPDGGKYRGHYKLDPGTPHGPGVLWGQAGGFISADFVDGVANGNGTAEMSNGVRYVGDFAEGVPAGRGVCVSLCGGTSDRWVFAQVETLWLRSLPLRSVNTGQFNPQGEPEGEGELQLPNGDTYCGQFARSHFEGIGKFRWAETEGRHYEGEWKNGQMHGQGMLQLCDGDGWYNGQFVEGVFEGRGKRMFGNGDNYTGEWKQSVMDGTGVYNWKDSDAVQYLGQFVAGRADGSGKKTWREGTYFVGQFKADFSCGNGLLVTEGAAGESAVAGTFEPAASGSMPPIHNLRTPDGSVCMLHVEANTPNVSPQGSPAAPVPNACIDLGGPK